MDALITIIPACDVTALYKEEAQQWSKWDSKNRKKFPYNYATEERVLVIKGSATLTPDDGSPAVTINAGDAVIFRIGFKCKWLITKRMTKHYAVFASLQDDAQEVEEGGITCDVCEVDCVAECYFVSDGESDICPSCYGKDESKYSGAQHQKNGEDWVEEKEQPKKTSKKSKAKVAPKKKAQKNKVKA
jgi:uncharacterized cupin superfamily protein